MPFVDFNNDIDINPYFFGHRGGIGNMQALPKTKIPSHPPVSKRPFVLVDKDTESSPRDIEGGRSKSANNLFIPNTKKEHDIREIEKLGAAYYTSSSYLPYPKELKAACDAHAPILPAQFKGAHEASCYASPVEALQYTHIPALDTPNVPLVAVNEHIPPPYILSPQSPPLSNVNVDLNLSDPLWDSPKSRHAKNSRILIVAIENHEGPISLSSLLKDCSRSVVVDVFFEVLALKSKDKISVSQSHPYGEIIVSKEVGV